MPSLQPISKQPHFPEHPLFRVNPGVWKSAEASIHKKEFSQGESIIHHGDKGQHLWLVSKGWIKLTRQTPDGKETLIGLCTDNDLFGEAVLFAHAKYPYNAEVISEKAELIAVSGDMIRNLVAKDHLLSNHIMTLLNERASQATLKLEHINTLSAAQRLGCFLLRLCHQEPNGSKVLEIPIEKNILAAYLGVTPETLSRSQNQLKPLGIEVHGGRITIHDIAKLRNFVCNSCSESGDCDIEAASN